MTIFESVRSIVKFSLLALVILVTSPIAANSQVCGDLNGDSSLNFLDLTYLYAFFYQGGQQPVDLSIAEFDGYENLTPRDFTSFNASFCCGGPLPNCFNLQPPYQVKQDSAFKISHTKWVEANNSQAILTIELSTEKVLSTVILPLEIRVGNEIPLIDSIDLELFNTSQSGYLIDSTDGRVLLFIVYFIGGVPENTTVSARVFITVDSSSLRRPVAMNWSHFAPALSLSSDSSLVPMVNYWQEIQSVSAEPIMICCLGTIGDFNEDGDDGNVLDLTHLVDYIFRGSSDTGSCPEETDLNEDGASSNILDLTTLVDYIFRGGASLPSCYF